jgi:outer membrane protein W
MKSACALVVMAFVAAAPASAQSLSKISLRPFVEVTEESFNAIDTFTSVFGRTYQPFWGGGLQVTAADRYYVELTASRFRKGGDRVFRNAGQTFHLGIPLTATLTPFEIVGGYRFHSTRRPWLVPYVGAGVGRYAYRETSQFAAAGEDLDTSHAGFVVHGGGEFRLSRWVGIGTDVQFTHVPGIFGTGGISQDVGEKDLGGFAARVKFVVGR